MQQKASAFAGVVAAAASVFGLFNWNNGQPVPSGTDNVQGNVSASGGNVSVGHGSTVNIVSSVSNPEAERRDALGELSLFIECNFGAFPTVAPPSGKIYFMEISTASAEWGGAGLAYFLGPAGSTMGFGPGQLAYECKLTNYSPAPVFNVELPISLTFKEALTVPGQPNSRQMGALRANREWLIVIPKLDANKDNPFVFYIRSTSRDFVDVSPPKDVTLQQGAGQTKRTVRLILPPNPSINLTPHVPTHQ